MKIKELVEKLKLNPFDSYYLSSKERNEIIKKLEKLEKLRKKLEEAKEHIEWCHENLSFEV